MAHIFPASDPLQRLVDQVQSLSALLETLTLRLLEIEERLAAHERDVEEAQSRSLGAEAERRLADTEERLQDLEKMLAASPPALSASIDEAEVVADRAPSVIETAVSEPAPRRVDGVGAELRADLHGRRSGNTQLSEVDDADTDSQDDEGWELEDDGSEREPLTA